MNRHTTARRIDRGFTVIELLMVVSIISIIAAFAIPRIDLTRYRTDAAARLVRTLLMASNRNAITRQSNVIVSIDTVYSRLRIVQDYNNNDTLNTADWTQFRALADGGKFRRPTMNGLNGTSVSAAWEGSMRTVSAMPSIIFRRDGSASTDMVLYLTIRPSVPTDYRAISVVANTGRTDMYRWSGAAWVRMSQ
ncbi:MAG: prepilin-type N-terminal cleavage/methylation domain-containing protein [Gemmatimonadetes bacterium]|nr:prepilin-type N-terminal cleavage/methylation domain-containing protein [Gemmatimonadota bacterium]